MDSNILSKKFRMSDMARFTFPTIVMMIFTSLYVIVDGIFVSRLVGTYALSAINIVMPFVNIFNGIGVMLGTGGSAYLGKKLGEGKEKEACGELTVLIVFAVILGVLLSLLTAVIMEPLFGVLGASRKLLPYCRDYMLIYLFFFMPLILQIMFQMLLVTAGRPKLGMWLTILAGCANIALDYIFIALFDMGISGAALGTGISCLVGSLPSILYFLKKKNGLCFRKPVKRFSVIKRSVLNGSSEMVSNIASGITTFLFNLIMMKFAGEEGVAAITIVLYTQFLFTSVYFGFSSGIAPVISFNYGSGNTEQLKRLFKMCMTVIVTVTVALLGLALGLADFLVGIFVEKESVTYELSLYGYRIYVWNFLFAGINIFASSLFTALSNGAVSAAISFIRTFGAEVLAILLLPIWFLMDGVWAAIPVAELVSCFLSVWFLVRKRKEYHYI